MDNELNILIFVLDDNKMITTTIGILLEHHGFLNYKLFTEPDDLLQNLNENVHICIIDYRLNNNQNGIDVIEKIREKNPFCYFIMLSGIESFEVIKKFTNTVIRGRFVSKGTPETDKQLITYIREFFADIQMMANTYQRLLQTKKNLSTLKTLLENRNVTK